MIQVVADNLILGDEARFHFIVQQSHHEQYALKSFLNHIATLFRTASPRVKLVACCLRASLSTIMMANSDQFVEWDSKPISLQDDHR